MFSQTERHPPLYFDSYIQGRYVHVSDLPGLLIFSKPVTPPCLQIPELVEPFCSYLAVPLFLSAL